MGSKQAISSSVDVTDTLINNFWIFFPPNDCFFSNFRDFEKWFSNIPGYLNI